MRFFGRINDGYDWDGINLDVHMFGRSLISTPGSFRASLTTVFHW